MSQIDGTHFSRVGTDTTDALTNAFVLHPIACALAFIAALCSIGGVIGGLVGSIFAVIAWAITLVVMVIDFVVFGVCALSSVLSLAARRRYGIFADTGLLLQVIKNHVNKDGSGSHAVYSVGMWTCLAAMVLLFLGAIIVFFTCCTRRRKGDHAYRESKRSSRRY
jgi:hypothetical protein